MTSMLNLKIALDIYKKILKTTFHSGKPVMPHYVSKPFANHPDCTEMFYKLLKISIANLAHPKKIYATHTKYRYSLLHF